MKIPISFKRPISAEATQPSPEATAGTAEGQENREENNKEETEDVIESGGFIPKEAHYKEALEDMGPVDAGELKQKNINKKDPALYFNYVLRGGIFLSVFLVPLFYFFSSDSIGLSKSLLLSALSLLILVSWVGKVISRGEFSWRRTWLVWPALGVALVAILSTIFSVAPWVSFLGDVGRHSFSTVSILAYVIIFLAALQNLKREDALWLIVLMVSSGSLAAIVSLLQFLGIFVLPGQFTHVALFTPVGSVFDLALFAVLTIPILIELFYEVPKRWIKILWAVLGVFGIFVATVVNFKVAWVALVVSFIFLVLMNFRQSFAIDDENEHLEDSDNSIGGRRLVLPLVVLVIAALFWFLPTIPGPRLVNTPVEVNPSYGASFNVAKDTWTGGFKNALVGSGPETFVYSYAEHKSADLNGTNFWGVNFNSAPAEFLTSLVNFGFLGLLAWLLFAGGFLWTAIKSLRDEPSALQVGIFASWIFVLVTKFLYQTALPLELFFWMLPAMFLITIPQSEYRLVSVNILQYRLGSGSKKATAIFVVLILLLVTSVGGLYLSVQRWMSENSYAKIFLAPNNLENRDNHIVNVAGAINLNRYEARYYRTFSQLLLNKVNDITGVAQARAQDTPPPAGTSILTQEEATQIQNITTQIFNSYSTAQSLDPKNTSLLVEMAESYKLINSYVSGANLVALSLYERAVEVEPVNPFLRTQLGQLYLIRDGFFVDTNIRQSEGIAEAKKHLEEAVKLNPQYSNARYFLAFILDREGDKDGALTQFELVLALNPDNQIIQSIILNLRRGFTALGPPRPPEPEVAPETGGDATGIPER